MAERLVTTGEMARLCSVTTETVVSWIKSGKLEACSTPGGRYRISLAACVRLLKEYNIPVPKDWESEEENQEMIQMNESVLSKACLPDLVANLKKSYKVFGPTPRGNQSAFEEIEDAAALQLDYTTTILPPKKFVLPPRETLLEFNSKDNSAAEPPVDSQPIAVLGIHPCDMQGILRLDYAFKKGQPESNYLCRREKMLFIGVSCNPDDYCFCSYVPTSGRAIW